MYTAISFYEVILLDMHHMCVCVSFFCKKNASFLTNHSYIWPGISYYCIPRSLQILLLILYTSISIDR